MRPNGIWKTCAQCGTQFYVQKHRAEAAKFCSMACLWKGRSSLGVVPTGSVLECANCGKPYYVSAGRVGRSRFCSRRCTMQFYAVDREDARLAVVIKHGNTRRDAAGKKSFRSPEYRSWQSMLRRCVHDRWYVENGIEVCERWRTDFNAFLTDMGRKPSPEHSLDRYPDAYGNYEPGNCRWATSAEQAWSKIGKKASAETRALKQEASRRNLHRGTAGNQKLSIEDVREIRRLEGIEKRPIIAGRYGLNIWHVRDIQKRRTWAWLE